MLQRRGVLPTSEGKTKPSKTLIFGRFSPECHTPSILYLYNPWQGGQGEMSLSGGKRRRKVARQKIRRGSVGPMRGRPSENRRESGPGSSRSGSSNLFTPISRIGRPRSRGPGPRISKDALSLVRHSPVESFDGVLSSVVFLRSGTFLLDPPARVWF